MKLLNRKYFNSTSSFESVFFYFPGKELCFLWRTVPVSVTIQGLEFVRVRLTLPFFILGVLNPNKWPETVYFKVFFFLISLFPQASKISLNWSWLSALNLICFSLTILSLHVTLSLQFAQLPSGLNKGDWIFRRDYRVMYFLMINRSTVLV